jgi:neutral ceramidase
MLKKRNFLRPFAYFLGVLVLLGVALIAPIDRTPLVDQPFYQQAMKSLDTLAVSETPKTSLKAGWAKVNITPKGQMPMAGYMQRDHYDSVHDSLYIRIIVLESGGQTIAMINADLLLFPPVLKERLQMKLDQVMPGVFLYLSATHNHNGIGAWDESLVGQFALGEFDYTWINQTVDAIATAIQNIKPIHASIQYWESDADELVINRIAHSKGKKDGMLRGFILNRVDSLKACLFTFSAHATTLTKENQTLSADYPSEVITRLEEGVDFGMFMAGMVGSHAFAPMPPEKEYDLVKKEGMFLTEMIGHMKAEPQKDSIEISTSHFPIPFGPAQLRISANWKARNWAFLSVLDDLEGELTYLKLGNILMIGTPCDFSGEIAVNEKLHAYAKARGLNLIITSFNGNYVGYITHDGHYDSINRTEIREMNWVGPYYGRYFSEMIRKMIDKSIVH